MADPALEIAASRFLIDSCFASSQFHELYAQRLRQLSPLVARALPADCPLCAQINQMRVGARCSIVGVIFKELASRPDVVRQYREIGFDSQPAELTASATDALFVEDGTGRIRLSGVRADRFPTGIVAGVTGALDPSKSEFRVEAVAAPAPGARAPPPARAATVGFVSALAVNARAFDAAAARGLVRALGQCQLCVVLGNCFAEKADAPPAELASFQSRMKGSKWPISVLESMLGTVRAPLLLLPGRSDPCAARLPQLPYHRCLFPSKEKWHLVTNPVRFAFAGTAFLCAAGESPADVARTTGLGFHRAQRALLKWRHLAPTAPDDLPTVASGTRDLLVLDEDDWPHVFVCGLADEFASSVARGVRVISVPEFVATKSAVFFDLASGDAVLRNFADFQ
jgi:DNA polymerase delta subunit 2